MMELEYRQKPFSQLTPEQQKLKLKLDKEYEQNVQRLSNPFYEKKRIVGVTSQEEEEYRQKKRELWVNYQKRAIAEGFYESVTVEDQLTTLE